MSFIFPGLPQKYVKNGHIYTAANDTYAADGNYTSGNIYCCRIGQLVIISWDSLAHASSASAQSSNGLIATKYRPNLQVSNVFSATTFAVHFCVLTTGGQLQTAYINWAGSYAPQTASLQGCVCFYTDN